MDADKLPDFGTIKTVHGDVETAFCIFSCQGSLLLYNKDFPTMFYYTQVFFWNINVLLGKQDCII